MEKAQEKKTILVVEDEVAIAKMIIKKLGDFGFEVLEAQTVAQALDALRSNKIDAIWLDHYLSGEKSGLDLAVELKAPGSEWAQLPIFVVSNTAGQDDIQSYIQLGVSKYFVKSDATLVHIIEDIKSFLESK